MRNRTVYQPYLEKTINQIYVEKIIAETEDDGKLIMDLAHPVFVKVINEDKTNAVGTPRGYEIKIMSAANNVLPFSDPVYKMASWMKYQFMFTKRKEREQHSVSLFNGGGFIDVPVDVETQYSDGDRMRNADIVAWVNVGVRSRCLKLSSTTASAYQCRAPFQSQNGVTVALLLPSLDTAHHVASSSSSST
jgi:Cu2+-containing amine oxidase